MGGVIMRIKFYSNLITLIRSVLIMSLVKKSFVTSNTPLRANENILDPCRVPQEEQRGCL